MRNAAAPGRRFRAIARERGPRIAQDATPGHERELLGDVRRETGCGIDLARSIRVGERLGIGVERHLGCRAVPARDVPRPAPARRRTGAERRRSCVRRARGVARRARGRPCGRPGRWLADPAGTSAGTLGGGRSIGWFVAPGWGEPPGSAAGVRAALAGTSVADSAFHDVRTNGPEPTGCRLNGSSARVSIGASLRRCAGSRPDRHRLEEAADRGRQLERDGPLVDGGGGHALPGRGQRAGVGGALEDARP